MTPEFEVTEWGTCDVDHCPHPASHLRHFRSGNGLPCTNWKPLYRKAHICHAFEERWDVIGTDEGTAGICDSWRLRLHDHGRGHGCSGFRPVYVRRSVCVECGKEQS